MRYLRQAAECAKNSMPGLRNWQLGIRGADKACGRVKVMRLLIRHPTFTSYCASAPAPPSTSGLANAQGVSELDIVWRDEECSPFWFTATKCWA